MPDAVLDLLRRGLAEHVVGSLRRACDPATRDRDKETRLVER
jgi:hypothetical protein